MKRIIPLILAVLFVLTACGSAAQQPAESTTATEQVSTLPDTGLTETEAETGTDSGNADVASPALEKAQTYIEKDLSELIAEFGQPESAEYVSSCLGPGEDGMLTYSEFVVYTYREDGQEIVKDVDVD